jgi:outer membrane receptor protein involved in Fe transport
VVVAGGRPDAELDTPRSLTILDGRQIDEGAPRTLPELLESVPGVMVQKTNHGGGSPYLRGFTGQHVLHLLDGVRLNNSTTRYGPNQALNTIDPFLVGRVELLRGPGSLLFGSDAIGGVIYLLSRDAIYRPGERFRFGGEATARYGSADHGQSYDLAANAQLHRVTLHAGGNLKWFGTLVGGRGIDEQPFTGYREGAWDGAVTYHFKPGWSLKLATSSLRQRDVPRTDSCTPTDFRYYRDQLRDLVYARVAGRSGKALDHFEAVLSYQSHRERRDRFRLARDRIEYESDLVHTAGLALVASTDLGRWSRLTYGADLYHDLVFSQALRESMSTGALTTMEAGGFRGRFVDGSRYLQGGVFVRDQLQPLSWLRLSAGARLSFAQAEIPADPLGAALGIDGSPISASFVGPVFGGDVTFVPHRSVHLILSAQQGFRAPNLDDYSHVGPEHAGFDVPSPGLDRAEETTTLEAGVKAAWSWLSLSAFGHYTFLSGFITRRYVEGLEVDGQAATQRTNASSGYVAGVEGSLALRLPRGFHLGAWLSFSRGDVTTLLPEKTTHPISRMTPLQGEVQAGYRHPRGHFARVSLRFAARQDRLAPNDLRDLRICPDGPDGCQGTPGFALVNLSGGVRITSYAQAVLRIENLGNAPYKMHGSGVYGPGLSAVMELQLRL